MTPLQQAAKNIIDRWDSPHWKDQPHTAEYIAELRKALDAEQAQAVEPVAFKQFLSDVVTAAGLVTHGKQCKALGERLSDGAYRYRLHPPQYDQQAMELCPECGWKAIMPGEPCFVCNIDIDAQQVKQVPMTDAEIYEIARLHPRICTLVPHHEIGAFVRAIEAHHNITPADWSAE